MAELTTPSYRWAAFSHWANLALLAAGGVAGAAIDPSLLVLLVPAQALVLWLAPDVPPFRASVDARFEHTRLLAERAYYLQQLWGLTPRPAQSMGERLTGLFVSQERDDFDERVMTRPKDFEKYLELRDILQKLRDMVPLASNRITERDVVRLEHVVNGYLRLLFACRPLGRAVSELDQPGMERELADVDARLKNADKTLKPVLHERKRLIESQLARAPKLRATLELLRARAEAIPYQLRNLHGQLLTDPGTEAHAMLNDMIERNDMLSDPLSDLQSDEAVREFLEATPAPVPVTPNAAAKRARAQGAQR